MKATMDAKTNHKKSKNADVEEKLKNKEKKRGGGGGRR